MKKRGGPLGGRAEKESRCGQAGLAPAVERGEIVR